MKRLILLLFFMPLLSMGQIKPTEKLLTVIGFSELDIESNLITLSMSAKENENTFKESEMVKMEKMISDFIKSIGLKPESFSVDRYSASTRFSITSGSKIKLAKSYKLVIEKPALLDTIVTKCFEFGMDNIYVSQQEHTKIDSLQNSLLAGAIQMANAKARIIATNASIDLGPVINLNESYQLSGNRTNYYDNDYKLDEVVVVGYSGSSRKSRSSSNVSLSKLHLSKTVVVKYEIK